MLILGAAETDYKINEISYQSSINAVSQLYGDCELTEAFIKAKEIGVPDVFLVNINTKTDYIDLIDVIKQYDFTYIVPLNIKFSDSFFNQELNRLMTYTELYLQEIGSNSNSTIIMTDEHASLYEYVDDFLKDMFSKIKSFKQAAQKALNYGNGLCLVANNLKDHPYANVLIASVLCVTEYKEYPTYNFGDAIFDIDDFDVNKNELAYFKNNILTDTSIENLKNFRNYQDAAKLVNIDRVIKYIDRELDFSQFSGKIFTNYIKLAINNKLKTFLTSIKNTAIRDFTIKSIDYISTSNGSGYVRNTFSILPYNSIEEFDMAMEV
jgi:hypothetical protein